MEPTTNPAYVLTSGQLSVITDTFTSNLAVILPVAIGLFAIGYGIKRMPDIIKWFKTR